LERTRKLSELRPGESGVIVGFTDDILAVKLMEMGCLPGVSVQYNFAAPMGDPICISVLGYELALRIEEASTISIIDA